MEALLRIGLSNAIVALALAVLAAVVSRCVRRPALTHSLWLLVLLKLITPPIVSIPLTLPIAEEVTEESVVAVGNQTSDTRNEIVVQETVTPTDPVDVEVMLVIPESDEVVTEVTMVPNVAAEPQARNQLSAYQYVLRNWPMLVLVVWLAGSVGWVILAAIRIVRFQRLLRYAQPAPMWLQHQADVLSQQLGIAWCPPVYLIPGHVSPMLWAILGAPRLLLPSGLWERLDEEQRATLLVHELAHLRRGDHWLRLLELVVTAVYWWHPAVWWARSELRRAEEDCCDAWVVWLLPGSARAYAMALVETLDFLSEARKVLPLEASGIGHIHDLRRRLTMIMTGATPRRLSWTGFLTVVGLAIFLLPVLPTFAQEEEKKTQDPRAKKEETPRPDDVRKTEEDIARARRELDNARRELEQAEARLRELHARQGNLPKGSGERKPDDRRPDDNRPGQGNRPGPGGSGGPGAPGGQNPPVKIRLLIEGPDGKVREVELPREGGDLRGIIQLKLDQMGGRVPPPFGQGGPNEPRPGQGGPGVPGDRRPIDNRPGPGGPGDQRPGFPGGPGDRRPIPGPNDNRPGPGDNRPGPGGPGDNRPGPGPGGPGDNRPGPGPGGPQDLERRLDQLIREIEEIRRQIRPGQDNRPQQPPPGGNRRSEEPRRDAPRGDLKLVEKEIEIILEEVRKEVPKPK